MITDFGHRKTALLCGIELLCIFSFEYSEFHDANLMTLYYSNETKFEQNHYIRFGKKPLTNVKNCDKMIHIKTLGSILTGGRLCL